MKDVWFGRTRLLASLCCVALLFVAGCNGGGGDDGSSGGKADESGASQPTATAGYAGTYKGTFAGDDQGSFTAKVAADGAVTGSGYSAQDGDFSITGEVSPDGSFEALATTKGQTDIGSTFRGEIEGDGSMAGKWVNSYWGMSGSFSGQKQ